MGWKNKKKNGKKEERKEVRKAAWQKKREKKKKKNLFQPLFQCSLHLYSLCLLACVRNAKGSFWRDTKECVCFLLDAELSMSEFGEELQILKSQLLCGCPCFYDYANCISKDSMLFLLKLHHFLSTLKNLFSFLLYLYLTRNLKKTFFYFIKSHLKEVLNMSWSKVTQLLCAL